MCLESKASETTFSTLNLTHSQSLSISGISSTYGYTGGADGYLGKMDFSSLELDSSQAYLITGDFTCKLTLSRAFYIRSLTLSMKSNVHDIKNVLHSYVRGTSAVSTYSPDMSGVSFIVFGDETDVSIFLNGAFKSSSTSTTSGTIKYASLYDLTFTPTSIVSIGNVVDIDAVYEEAYNLGYSEGETAGYTNGYDVGYTEGVETGQSSGYETGYTEGYDIGHSDGLTEGEQIGYQTGYTSGYNVGYSEGVASGYQTGYSDAMSRIESFGGDSTAYPVNVSSSVDGPFYMQCDVTSVYPTPFDVTSSFYMLDYEFNPSHTYKLEIFTGQPQFTFSNCLHGGYSLTCNIGSSSFVLKGPAGGYSGSCYIPGDSISDLISMTLHINDLCRTSASTPAGVTVGFDSVGFVLYDYGPVSNSQNQIANQTDILQDELGKQTEQLQEQTEQAKEQTETQKGIFNSIKEFFAGFFQNLIDSVLHLFVPTSDEMSDLLDELNQFFSDTFGFLYAPFDYFIQLVNVFLTADAGTGLTLPGFSIMGFEVWADLTYDLSSDPLVGQIFEYVRIGTGVLLACWFIMYLQNFFKERFGKG